MSVSVEEAIESLEGIDLEGAPRCEVRLYPDFIQRCNQPSVARIKHQCPDCGRTNPAMFICAECLEDIKANTILCRDCDCTDLRWAVI